MRHGLHADVFLYVVYSVVLLSSLTSPAWWGNQFHDPLPTWQIQLFYGGLLFLACFQNSPLKACASNLPGPLYYRVKALSWFPGGLIHHRGFLRLVTLVCVFAWVVAWSGMGGQSPRVLCASTFAWLHAQHKGGGGRGHNWYLPMWMLMALCLMPVNGSKPRALVVRSWCLFLSVFPLMASGYCKVVGNTGWLDGTTLQFHLNERKKRPVARFIGDRQFLCKCLSIVVLIFQDIIAPLALINRQIRIVFPFLAACMHVGIALVMKVDFYAHAWCYILLFDANLGLIEQPLLAPNAFAQLPCLTALLMALAAFMIFGMIQKKEAWPYTCFPLFSYAQDTYPASSCQLLAQLNSSRTHRMKWKLDWAAVQLVGDLREDASPVCLTDLLSFCRQRGKADTCYPYVVQNIACAALTSGEGSGDFLEAEAFLVAWVCFLREHNAECTRWFSKILEGEDHDATIQLIARTTLGDMIVAKLPLRPILRDGESQKQAPAQVRLGHLLPLQEQVAVTGQRITFVCPKNSSVFIVRGVLSPAECNSLIDAAENLVFAVPGQFSPEDRKCERVHTVDPSLSAAIMDRLRAFIPEILVVDGTQWRLTRFTHHWRYVRYFKGGHFAPHYDVAKMLPWAEMTMFTVQVYLNSQKGNFTGGATDFYMDYRPDRRASRNIVDGKSRSAFPSRDALGPPTCSVQPCAGDVLIFDHAGRSVFHAAGELVDGCKYILRGDLLYAAVEPGALAIAQTKIPKELRVFCPDTAAVLGTRDFTGQVWQCDCASDHHGSGSCRGSWEENRPYPLKIDFDFANRGQKLRERLCVLISGKRASGKDHIASILHRQLQRLGLIVEMCALGSVNKRVYAAKVGINAQRLQTDRAFKETHRIAMVEHHRNRNLEDPDWCLNEVWQQSEDADSDILMLTDFRTLADHRWFAKRCSSKQLLFFRVEASDEARAHRGWTPDPEKDGLYSETDLDTFSGWSACFDNSNDDASGLLDEWVAYTAVPRICIALGGGR